MLDLSHLTEEEQEMIMTVLKRDAELKKAEEDRIGKLQEVVSTGSRPESSLKYLTGEWFYEAKSRRHMDKIHGSEIILASMKQWKSGPLDGSLRLETPKTLSDRGSDSVPPPKPARQLEPTQCQEMSTLDVEIDKLNSEVRSPARTRHNPFNRASLILEAPERADEMLINGNSEVRKSSETDHIAPLKNHAAGQASQMSGGSTTSDCSSVGFKPVPKKRTFVSRRSSTPSTQSDGSGLGTQPGPTVILPAPRRSLRCVSNGISKLPSLEGTGEQSQKSTTTKSNDVASSEQALITADVISQQPHCDAAQVSLHIDLEMDRNTPSIATDRQTANASDKSYHKPSIKDSSPPAERNKNDRPTDRASPDRSDVKGDMSQRDHGETQADSLSTATIQDAERMKNGRVEAVMRQGDLSFTQSIEDEPICYDLDFIDKPALHTRTKSNPNLMLQTPNPSGEEEDSIAKVLEWFSRSTDSNDWLDKEGGHQAIVNIDRKADISVEDSVTKDMDIYKNRNRDRKREAPEMKRAHREAKDGKDSMEPIKLRATDRMDIQEVTEMHEEARKCSRPQEVKETEGESQPPKISHLKSFWEKGNTGPKILISRSNTNSDKGQKPTLPATEKDREKEVNENQCLNSDMFSAPGLYGGKGKYEKDAFNVKDKQEKELLPLSQQKDKGSIENVQLNITPNQQTEYTAETHTSPGFMGNNQSPGTQRKDDIKYSTDYMSLPDNAQVVDRRGSDTEIVSLTRSSSQPKMQFVSRLSPESETFSPLTSSPQPDSLPQARGSPLPIRSSSSITTPQHEDLIDANLQARASPDSEKLHQYRHSPYLDRRSTKMQMQRSSSEDVKRKDNEERNVQSYTSPKKQDDSIGKDRSNSPHSQRHGPQRQESTAERIKQLKAFWEQERNKPANYTGLSKGSGDAKATRCTNLGKLNNRFTKSAYDLRSIGNDSSSDDEGNRQNRLDKLSPTKGVNRVQFKNLRQFWGEATSNCKGSFDKPKKKDQIDGDSLAVGPKQCVDPELYKPNPVQAEKTSTRPVLMKSSSHSQTQKSPHDRQFGSVSGTGNDNKSSLSHYFTTESGQLRDSRRGSKDSTREEKPPKLLSNVGKETRSPKAKRDHLSGRGSSLCRATSMFSLNVTEDNEEPFPGQLKKNQEASPVQDRRQGADRTQKRRQSADKGVTSRRPTEDSESLAPRARAFVPRDYRHYLGMTEKTSVHTSLAPAVKEQGLEGKPAYDLDSTGPVRASTPMGSEERYGRRVSKTSPKTSPRPLWGNSGSDTGRDSSISSASDTCWSSRNSSNRENDDEDQNPVRRALRRAEARPKNLAKSLEDITASLTPRQERRQDPIVDLRRSSDAPSIPSPSSSSFSDPEHLKKMSKSVPSFLQKEVDGTEPDSTSEDSYHGHRPKTGRSMTNLSNSSGMASSFSLSGSVMTMYSGDYGSVEVQGNIQFSINYVQKLREFHIFVAQCRDLAAVDPKRGRSDPYVKSYLVPDNANLGKRKTSVRKKTQNPTFNEILRYRVRMEYLRTQTLILSVWHHDTFGKNSFLGEVDVDLSKWDFDHTQMNYLALKARPATSSVGPSDDRGEMRLAIRFLPQITHSEGTAKDGPNTGEIHIWVKECKNLPLIRATIDPYIKCFVLPDTSRKSRQKTRVLRRTVDPIFNHTMVYDGIRQEDLTDACVELTVWDRDRLASNLLGGMRLGLGTGRSYGAVVDWMDSTTYEVALWERMMASPNEWVEDVLPLRMLTPAKTALK